MLVENNTGEAAMSSEKRGFYSLYSGKEYHVDLPESYGRACFGSSGWLVTLGTDQKMHLLNPLTRKQLPLPSQTTFTDQYPPDCTPVCNSHSEYLRFSFVHKALVYWAGGKPIVFVIYSQYRKLAMARPGDEAWTPVESSTPVEPSFFGVLTIDLFRGQVLVLLREQFFVCDLSVSPPTLEKFHKPALPKVGSTTYLADMGGDLYALVCHLADEDRCSSGSFCPVKYCFAAFIFNTVKEIWEEVDNLGGWATFVGRNSTLLHFDLLTTHPCRPDCIYFTDDNSWYCEVCGGSDFGIFSINPSSDKGSDNEDDSGGVDNQHTSINEDVVESDGESDSGSVESDDESDSGSVESDDDESDGGSVESDSESDSGSVDNDRGNRVDLFEMSRRPFSVSNDQLSVYAPPLWLAPSLWDCNL